MNVHIKKNYISKIDSNITKNIRGEYCGKISTVGKNA